jgi:hypothetical protein
MFNFLIRFAAASEFAADMDMLSNSVLFSDLNCRTAFERVLDFVNRTEDVMRDSAPRARKRFKGISTRPIPGTAIDPTIIDPDFNQLRSAVASSILETKHTIDKNVEAGQWEFKNAARLYEIL